MATANLVLPRVALAASGAVAFSTSGICFRDLADFSHWVHKPDRDTVMKNFARRHELTAAYLVSTAVNIGVYLRYPNALPTKIGALPTKYAVGAFNVFTAGMWFLGYINPEIMMRPRNHNALYVTVAEADKIMRPEETLIVTQMDTKYDKNQPVYAFADNQIQRPHIANLGLTKNGIPGIFAYCALTGGGIALEYPEKCGLKKRNPIPYIQLENNLIIFDKANGEWGHQLCCYNQTEMLRAMGETDYNLVARRPKEEEFKRLGVEPWVEIPTFRMTWKNFAKAFPDGKVFINDYREHPSFKRPVLTMYDKIMQFIWLVFIGYHKHSPGPIFPTVDDIDPRLYSKTRVWGFNYGDEWVAITEDFVKWDGTRNFKVDGVPIVASWDPEYESLGIFVRPDDKPIKSIVDVYGQVKDKNGNVVQGLERVSRVKPGMFWFAWSNFYPGTKLNPKE